MNAALPKCPACAAPMPSTVHRMGNTAARRCSAEEVADQNTMPRMNSPVMAMIGVPLERNSAGTVSTVQKQVRSRAPRRMLKTVLAMMGIHPIGPITASAKTVVPHKTRIAGWRSNPVSVN